jgi:hypothetical protein
MKIHLQRFLLILLTSIFFAKRKPSFLRKQKHETYTGFFNFYWEEQGKIWLQIDKLDEEILYQTSLPAGLGSNEVSLDRGILGQHT